ncbi:hypothetical protein PRIPAC_80517 [Pristionchus pacificus]|uniref:Uncharacterized protein n=1 Tax=Pristionchus pacificus TaxID=54126 RepID=A0A2A6BI05_PRIPA|nr:hypothetical protein PRIPAC_80517 [Pristionchus pacificus]|eukprot:PDM65493.1 hypothetical protein PRIPAC_52435 [Pristionchus pacificus]
MITVNREENVPNTAGYGSRGILNDCPQEFARNLVDEYAQQRRTTIQLVDELTLYGSRERQPPFRVVLVVMDVPKSHSALFQLRLRLRHSNNIERPKLKREDHFEHPTHAHSYKFTTNPLDMDKEYLAWLGASMGRRIGKVALLLGEGAFELADQLLDGLQFSKMKFRTRMLSNTAANQMLAMVEASNVETITLKSFKAADDCDTVQLLKDLSSSVRAIHIVQEMLIQEVMPIYLELVMSIGLRLFWQCLRTNSKNCGSKINDSRRICLLQRLPLLGKSVWFKATCEAYAIGLNESINDHWLTTLIISHLPHSQNPNIDSISDSVSSIQLVHDQSPFEGFPREMTWMIFDYTNESLHCWNKTMNNPSPSYPATTRQSLLDWATASVDVSTSGRITSYKFTTNPLDMDKEYLAWLGASMGRRLPLIGKSVWFKATCEAYAIGLNESINDHWVLEMQLNIDSISDCVSSIQLVHDQSPNNPSPSYPATTRQSLLDWATASVDVSTILDGNELEKLIYRTDELSDATASFLTHAVGANKVEYISLKISHVSCNAYENGLDFIAKEYSVKADRIDFHYGLFPVVKIKHSSRENEEIGFYLA